jgi:hypothetical protein
MLCMASKNNGMLPALDDIAIQLRVTAAKATEIIACLVKATLLDKTETGFAPHNWSGRQYKSDVSTDRVKRFRNAKRNVSETTSERPQITDTETDDRIGDAGARASAFTEGSKALASALWKALGFESPLAVPPEYAGIDWRAIEWERAGWTADLVDAVARQHGRKPLLYLEKCCGTEFAKRQAPLPIVEIRSPEKITVAGHGKPKSAIIQAADDLCERLASFDGPPRGADQLRGAEGETSPRLLSHR